MTLFISDSELYKHTYHIILKTVIPLFSINELLLYTLRLHVIIYIKLY